MRFRWDNHHTLLGFKRVVWGLICYFWQYLFGSILWSSSQVTTSVFLEVFHRRWQQQRSHWKRTDTNVKTICEQKQIRRWTDVQYCIVILFVCKFSHKRFKYYLLSLNILQLATLCVSIHPGIRWQNISQGYVILVIKKLRIFTAKKCVE